jgi:hypothetical protein
MRQVTFLGLAALSIVASTGAACSSGPDRGEPNPPRLWLDLDGVETAVRLVATEPREY